MSFAQRMSREVSACREETRSHVTVWRCDDPSTPACSVALLAVPSLLPRSGIHRCPVCGVVARRRGWKVELWLRSGPLGGRQASPDVEGVVGEHHPVELGGAAE